MVTFSFAQVQLRDIGVIGLASHDLFAWDKSKEENTENGRLDLSTIFDYDHGRRWKKGGNPKNTENAPVWSITRQLVNHYKNQLKNKNPKEARIATVDYFHEMIKDSFQRLSGLEFPSFTVNEPVNNTEQAVLRALHDILPGKAKLFRKSFPVKEFKLTDFIFSKFYLNEQELSQSIHYFDGDYDYEYKEIKIPFTNKIVNLKQVDGDFIEKFSPYKQEEMLAELKRVGNGEIHISEVYFIHHLKELFQKGLCSKNNQWIVNDLNCY